ncbi:glutamate--cysteine ligase-like [Ornithodoros turicata]|uniref:glutamate--cysteine ligase-like n=1 Tax=Ornithodoros turicata TaxID=34597 RepID=UPI003139819A
MSSVMEKLDKLKKCGDGEIQKMSNIPKNEKFEVLDIQKIDTMYGEAVYVELRMENDKPVKVYLPGRFKKLSEEELEEMRLLPNLKMEKKERFTKDGGLQNLTTDLSEAKDLYDQLANICPLMLALSASSPAFRGYLVDTDCRFDVITQSVDDRTDEEMGLKPLGPDAHLIKRPRYASVPWYLSSKGQHFNDVPMACDAKVYQALRSANVEEPLARHLSHVFIRDTLCLFSEKLKQDDNIDFDHFENLQSTSWHSLRFKPPPPKSSIGWRVEFRPTELQMTEFENAAYVVFVVLLTRVILTFDLDLIVPISKVDENMKIAQKRDAVLTEKFWFRKDILTHGCPSSVGGVPDVSAPEIAHMTVSEIINGKGVDFPGLVPLIRTFLTGVDQVDVDTYCTLHQYLTLIEKRASGQYMTAARWMRHFIMTHPEYKKDSVVTDGINYDLVMRMRKLQFNFWSCPELIGTPASRTSHDVPDSCSPYKTQYTK